MKFYSIPPALAAGLILMSSICALPFGLAEVFFSDEPQTIEIHIIMGEGASSTTVPANTPAPTFTPLPTFTPTVDFTLTTATPTLTPTALPPPNALGPMMPGATVSAPMREGVGYEWTFDGQAGMVITLNNSSTGMTVTIFDPDGVQLVEPTDGSITELTLPVTGTYTILGRATSGGLYSLRLDILE